MVTILGNQKRSRIYGMEYEEETDGERIRWRIFVHHPFRETDGKLRVGLNERLLQKALQVGVDKFVIGNGEGEILFTPPTEKELKRMERQGEVEYRQSIFEGREGFKIYHMKI